MSATLDHADGESIVPQPLAAMRRYFALVILPVVICSAASIVYVQTRVPMFRSEARVMVGRVDVASYAVSGAVQANRDLAIGYARVGTLPAVRDTLPADMRHASYVLTPIPESSIVRIAAEDKRQQRATDIVSAVANALLVYAENSNDNSKELEGLLADYQQAQEVLADATEARKALPNGTSSQELRKADANVAAQQLRADTASKVYQERRSRVNGFGDLTLVSPATPLGHDQSKAAQMLAALSLVVGLVVGAALAILWDYTRRSRAARRQRT